MACCALSLLCLWVGGDGCFVEFFCVVVVLLCVVVSVVGVMGVRVGSV